jgi:hypothetical protein
LNCKKCKAKLGSDCLIGPKSEPAYSFKAEEIYFLQTSISGRKTKHEFMTDKKKWKDRMIDYPTINSRNFDNFFGKNSENIPTRTNFVKTIFPTEKNVISSNIFDLVEETPRKYQV